jgi:hypothetical protein
VGYIHWPDAIRRVASISREAKFGRTGKKNAGKKKKKKRRPPKFPQFKIKKASTKSPRDCKRKPAANRRDGFCTRWACVQFEQEGGKQTQRPQSALLSFIQDG